MPFKWPISRKIIPTSDLGLPDGVDFGLEWPDDSKISLALLSAQTPNGARVVQLLPNGGIVFGPITRALLRAATDVGAGSSQAIDATSVRHFYVVINVSALTGAPTNIIYTIDYSEDNGATWTQAAQATQTTAGLSVFNVGTQVSGGNPGGNLKNSVTFGALVAGMWRISWTFTGGTAPGVTHRMVLVTE